MDLSGGENMSSNPTSTSKETSLPRTHLPGDVKQRAHHFDGLGNYSPKDWNFMEANGNGGEFYWYHVEIPQENQKLAVSTQYLIDILCPPLKFNDILPLVSNGPAFCSHVDGALVFRVNSPGPAESNFTLRLAARVTENSVVTVSLGRVPRLGSSPTRWSLLSEIASVGGDGEKDGSGSFVIPEHVLEFLLTKNHSVAADIPVPKTVSNLVVHIVDAHVDHVQDIATNLEMELDSLELELDKGGSSLKQQMLDDRRFPKMLLNLQRLLQVVSHCEHVFLRVKEKCATKSWFASEDIVALEELIDDLRRLKENLGFLANRVTAVQAGLDSWQSEQINRKLYYLSIFFLPLSIITGIFGMNVGGVPWTGQSDPELKDGFSNVMILCAVILFLLLFCFIFPSLYAPVLAWTRQRAPKKRWSIFTKKTRSWSIDIKSFWRRMLNGKGDYTRI